MYVIHNLPFFISVLYFIDIDFIQQMFIVCKFVYSTVTKCKVSQFKNHLKPHK